MTRVIMTTEACTPQAHHDVDKRLAMVENQMIHQDERIDKHTTAFREMLQQVVDSVKEMKEMYGVMKGALCGTIDKPDGLINRVGKLEERAVAKNGWRDWIYRTVLLAFLAVILNRLGVSQDAVETVRAMAGL